MKNSMKTPDQKKRSKQLGKEIRDSRKRYEDLRVHGGSDPFWSDGANMNLCRNHVMYFRKQVETELDPENYPEEYFLEIPAEVSVQRARSGSDRRKSDADPGNSETSSDPDTGRPFWQREDQRVGERPDPSGSGA